MSALSSYFGEEFKKKNPDNAIFTDHYSNEYVWFLQRELIASRDSQLSAAPSEERRLLATMIGLAEAYLELFQSDDKPSKAMLVLDMKIINDAKKILQRGIAG